MALFGKLVSVAQGGRFVPALEILDGQGGFYFLPSITTGGSSGFGGLSLETHREVDYASPYEITSWSWSQNRDESYTSSWQSGQDSGIWSYQAHQEISGYHAETAWGTVDALFQKEWQNLYTHSENPWSSTTKQHSDGTSDSQVVTQTVLGLSVLQEASSDKFDFSQFVSGPFVSQTVHAENNSITSFDSWMWWGQNHEVTLINSILDATHSEEPGYTFDTSHGVVETFQISETHQNDFYLV